MLPGDREGRSHLSIRNCGLQRTLIIVFQGSLKAIKGLNKDNLKTISKVSEFLLFFLSQYNFIIFIICIYIVNNMFLYCVFT